MAKMVSHCTVLHLNLNKKDGYRQRKVRQFLHILAFSWYALYGTIAVNVTWMER